MISALLFGRIEKINGVEKVSINDVDCAIAYCGLEELDADVTIKNNWLVLSDKNFRYYTVCIGGVTSCRSALYKMGVKDYDIPCYPKELKVFMNREVEEIYLKDLLKNINKSKPRFIKPVKPKRFSAFATPNKKALDALYPVDPDESVYSVEVVKFCSEWRAYIKNGEIVKICNYSGNPLVFPNIYIIKTMISAWKGPCCYAIDVGVIGGETRLVEVNDFYSIGNYGLEPTEYVEMLILRWGELTKQKILC
jgi:hypothetical protein